VKRLIVGLYLLFGLLLVGTITLSVRSYDGPVEEHYSARGERFLQEREREEAIGLTIRVPDRIETGENRFAAALSTANGPLRNASVSIRAMRVRGPGEDREVSLREDGAGIYTGKLPIPTPGIWMLQLSVRGAAIDAVRNWIVSADAGAIEPERAAGDIHSGPVAGTAGPQPVILEVEPRPVRALRDLRFTLRLPGYAGDGAPWIDLSMPGMRMPPNRVNLVREKDGLYRGAGVIVRCRSGKRAWQASVTVPGKGTAVFTFDVAP